MSQQINLFNPIFKQQKKYFSAVTMAQALGLILAGALLVGAYAGYRLTALKSEAAGARTRLNDAQQRLAKSNVEYPPRQKDKALEIQVKDTGAELSSLQRVSDILQRKDFGNKTGYADYFRAFARQTVSGVWLTGLSIQGADNEIGLQGRALTPELLPTFIGKLKKEAVLQGKSFSVLEMHLRQQRMTNQDEVATQEAAGRYIEFSLRSSGIASEPETATGAQNK